MSTQDFPKPVAWMMVNPTNPRLTPSVTLTPETGWHITWESRPLYDQAVIDAAVAAERERWAARVEEAFRDGFYSPRTYNDTVLNTADEAWEEAKAGLLQA